MKPNVMYSKFGNRLNYCWRQHNDRRKKGKEGRLWIYYGSDLDHKIGGTIHLEYCVLDPVYLLGGGIEFGYGDEPIGIDLWVWPLSLYLRIDSPLARRITNRVAKPTYDGERETAVHIAPRGDRSTIRWSIWHPVHSWSSGTPRWRNGHFDLVDFLLGRRDMRWETVSTHSVLIPMPERSYPATVEMRDHVSWRKRLPFQTRRVRCADVEIPGGIGFAGKRENAWDCGDDAIFAMSCGAETVDEAIGKVVASVYRNRMKYGGSYSFTPIDNAA